MNDPFPPPHRPRRLPWPWRTAPTLHGSLAERLADGAQRVATQGMALVAALTLVVATGLLWQRSDVSLRLAGSEMRGSLTASLQVIQGAQSELARRGRLRQAAQDGPDSLTAAQVRGDLLKHLQSHGAVTALWLLDDNTQPVMLLTRPGAPASLPSTDGGPAPDRQAGPLPAEVRTLGQSARVAASIQTGWRESGGQRELLLAQPIRLTGSHPIEGLLVSAVSIDHLLQPLRAALPAPMRADILIGGGEISGPWAWDRSEAWPIQLQSSSGGRSHAMLLRLTQAWWSALLPALWLALAYTVVGALLVTLVRQRVKALAEHAVQPLQALRDAAAKVAQDGLTDIPEMSVKSLLEGGAEVQNLASSFADMLERLFAAQGSLEATVSQRTAELAQQQDMLQRVVESVKEVIFQTDAEGRWVYLNPAWERITGHAVSESLGLHFLATMHPADHASALLLFEGMQRGELDEARHEGRFRTLQGEERWLAAHVRLLRSSNGQPCGCSGTLTDVTEQRAAEATLRLRNRAMDASHNGIVLLDVRKPGRPLVFANEGFTRISGYRREEVIGRSLSFLQGPEQHQPGAEAIRSALAAGEPCRVLLSNYRKDGQRYDNDLSISPVHDERTGEVTHYIGISSDVTQRLLAERLLRDQFARLDTLFALSPDGFVSFDALGRVVSTNPAFESLTGLPRHDLIGLSGTAFEERLAERVEQRNPPGMAHWQQDRSSGPGSGDDGGAGSGTSTDVLVLRGVPRRVLVCSRRDCNAPNVSRVLHLRDITRETEVDRMKSEFLSTAAHELRTPMASIRGFSDLLMMRKFDEERTRDLLQTINRQSIWLTDMVNELLDLARIEARKGKDFQLEVTPLREAAEAAVKSLLMPGDERRVRCHLVEGLPSVRVDRAKIQHALTNVISNAYKYSPQGGDIELRLLQRQRPDGTQVGIAVCDQGIGMAPEHAERAFERFFRADSSGSIPGTGLGLALVKEIVELHGGQVELHSQLGVGTTVTMWLPAWNPETVDS